MTRVLICGGRDYTGYLHFASVMAKLKAEHGPFKTVIHGGGTGADWCAHLWANSPIGHVEEIEFKADWELFGKSAGPIRNQRMIDEGKPELVIAFPGGRGTADMVRRAKAANIETIEVESP